MGMKPWGPRGEKGGRPDKQAGGGRDRDHLCGDLSLSRSGADRGLLRMRIYQGQGLIPLEEA